MKGVILAGGSGTRLHPLTRITNKHLLPLYDRPMVTYAVEALVRAGVTELMLVSGGAHAGEFMHLLGNGRDYGIDLLTYGYQERAGGIAEALGLAEHFVARDRVCVMLADNIFETSLRPIVEKPVTPPSNYAVTGVYFYDSQVWDVLPTLEPSGRGELEITDVNNWYVGRGEMEADVVDGFWGDAGESIDAYYAVNDFVRTKWTSGASS